MMKREFQKRIIKIAVLPKGGEIFSEEATFIEVADEAAGEFVEISQSYGLTEQKIRLDDDEWPVIRDAIEEMVKEIKKHQKATA